MEATMGLLEGTYKIWRMVTQRCRRGGYRPRRGDYYNGDAAEGGTTVEPVAG